MDTSQTNVLPTKEEIAQLPLFINLAHNKIHVITTLEQCKNFEQELKNTTLFGFDTESKPTFRVGEKSTGPHLIQLATSTHAYLFRVNSETLSFLQPILSNPEQIKIGFGLKNDAHLFRKKGIELNMLVDLSKSFSEFGINTPLGIRNAMALLFRVNFPKSKKISTSNWSTQNLSPQQIAYAAADAYAPVLVFEELKRLKRLPSTLTKKI